MRVEIKQVWSVGRVASWNGYCLPCGREDRPLVLTRSGASGLRAWVAGIGDDERTLLLTCRVCGDWQIVPLREEDDPEIAVAEALGAAAPVAPVMAMTRPAAAAVPAAVRPPSRRTAPAAVAISTRERVPLPFRGAPTQAAVPSPDAVAAARSVLSAARSGQQRSATPRPARPARRGHRRGPTPRRPDHAGSRKPRPSAVPVAEATSIVLPLDLLTSGHSLLLAAG